ncbi:MAG: hypothetical protein ACI83E_002253 [Sulfitobacter sp.]|jgi:hypothetical protein
MPRLGAKMRDIDDRGGIICLNFQYPTRGDRLQTFARFEHGQGAQQPRRIKDMFIIHKSQIRQMFQSVHNLVTGHRATVRDATDKAQ